MLKAVQVFSSFSNLLSQLHCSPAFPSFPMFRRYSNKKEHKNNLMPTSFPKKSSSTISEITRSYMKGSRLSQLSARQLTYIDINLNGDLFNGDIIPSDCC